MFFRVFVKTSLQGVKTNSNNIKHISLTFSYMLQIPRIEIIMTEKRET